MKRKKFVKQLMGEGIQRNLANQVAETSTHLGLTLYTGLGLYLNTYAMLLHGQDPRCLYADQRGGAK